MSFESPRLRRLRSDYRAMGQLRSESRILEFTVPGATFGGSPESYLVRFLGKGVWRPVGSSQILLREHHEVLIQLGANYPRMMPDITWKTPIFHPNISSGGIVCLGGYGTHWVPSLQLDELCTMLWDIVRYQNYDVNSAYNREAANWAKCQVQHVLPLDPRPIRDRIVSKSEPLAGVRPPVTMTAPVMTAPMSMTAPAVSQPELFFINSDSDGQVVTAELVDPPEAEILYID